MQEYDNQLQNESTGLDVTVEIKNYLKETSKWAKLFSILGFIYAGIIVLVGVFFMFGSSVISLYDLPGIQGVFQYGVGFFYIILGAVMVIPALYLYNFSTKMKIATELNNQSEFAESFKNLKSLYKFYGIITVIILGFYLLAIVLGVLGALLA